MKKIAIFGTSGFAYEVADIAYAIGYQEIVLLSTESNQISDRVFKVLPENTTSQLLAEGFEFAIGIGDGAIRKKIFNNYNNLKFPNLIHPTVVLGYQQINLINNSKGNILAAGVVLTNNIKVGNFGIYNLNCTVGHDCIINDFVSIMPSVNISGNVFIDECAFIGVAAVILQGSINNKMKVGKNAIVGAQSLVRKDIDDGCTVFGIPAKVINKR